MPQFNPATMYNPNQEYRIKQEGSGYRLYDLNPTNIVDMGFGARAAGGTVKDLGVMNVQQLREVTGLGINELYPVLRGGIEEYKANAVPDTGTIQSQLTQTFSGFDPQNQTGWKEKLPELTTKAQQLYSQDPTQKDKVYGSVWNEFRYNPQQAQTIGQIQQQNRYDFSQNAQGQYNPAYIIPQIADNSYVRLAGGNTVYLKTGGKELIPFLGTPPSGVIDVPLDASNWNRIGNVRPMDYAIGAGQTPQQAEVKYQSALNDTTTPRLIDGQIVSGSQALAQQAQQRAAATTLPVAGTPTITNPLLKAGIEKLKAQYPNDPQKVMEVFKSINPNAPADVLAQVNAMAQSMQQPAQPTQLPDSTNKVLDAAVEAAINTPNKNDISAAQFADWATIFHANNDPYFQQLNKQSQQDLQTGLSQIGQDLATGERKLATSYGANLAATQANAASRGLTTSSIRNQQERTLADTTQAAIEAGRQEAQRRALELGTGIERKVGSTNLGDLSSYNIGNAPTPQTGRPGLLGFNPSVGTRSLYTPTGGIIGSNQREQAAAQESFVNTQAANYRSLNPLG